MDSASSESREHGTLVFVCRQGCSRRRRGRGRFFPRGLFTVCGCWVLTAVPVAQLRIIKRDKCVVFELSKKMHYICTMTDLGVG